jgi:uroporphyrinogen III methyltransferase/synthase
MKQGKVWLVGAGPGDAGLLTVKGLEVLKAAEVVVYDSLVGAEVLLKIPEHARLVYVGKRSGHHTMKQEGINQVLLEEAQKGYRVVRLKGGDPFLFGRGGEELELLAAHGIPFEVVPGVTSPLAVPAYNGIPVTHRDFTSSLHIITGHKKSDSSKEIDYEALVRVRGTLVFLMSVTALPDIMDGLLRAGMRPDMPAAFLEKGTTAKQRRVVSTVAELKNAKGLGTPGLIVVGEVCALADTLSWYEKRPLAGWRVLLTRPHGRSLRTARLLRESGAEVLEIPTIEIAAQEDKTEIHKAFEKITEYRWLVFTSPSGVERFFEELFAAEKDIRCLGSVKIAAIGEGTRNALRQRGLFADLIPQVYDGDSLGAALAEKIQPGDKVLIPRAEVGNQNLVRLLEEAGAVVDDVATYHTEMVPSALIDVQKEFENHTVDCVAFTSSSTVRGFVKSVPQLDFSQVRAACIGKQTMEEAQRYGMQCEMSEKATIESLIELICRMREQDR